MCAFSVYDVLTSNIIFMLDSLYNTNILYQSLSLLLSVEVDPFAPPLFWPDNSFAVGAIEIRKQNLVRDK